MKIFSLLCSFLPLVIHGEVNKFFPEYDKNREPIIGILTIPTSKSNQIFSSSSFSMIPASYVKWLEQAGIRVIPIRYDLKQSTVRRMMQLINGVLVTGGSASLF